MGDTCAATATHAPPASRSAMGDVHRDFHAEAKVNRLRSFPLHDELPGSFTLPTGPDGPASPILAKARRRGKADHHESRLMIFMSPRSRRAATMSLGYSSPAIADEPAYPPAPGGHRSDDLLGDRTGRGRGAGHAGARAGGDR